MQQAALRCIVGSRGLHDAAQYDQQTAHLSTWEAHFVSSVNNLHVSGEGTPGPCSNRRTGWLTQVLLCCNKSGNERRYAGLGKETTRHVPFAVVGRRIFMHCLGVYIIWDLGCGDSKLWVLEDWMTRALPLAFWT